MNTILKIILYSFFSGITIILGGLLSRFLRIKNKAINEEIIHWAIAFGGGVLIAAVAFALIPKGVKELSLFWLITVFLSGTFTFFFIDRQISRKGGSLAQLMAMLMDFLPEALALGASFAHDHRFGLLLALFIGLQNFPEGFNAYRELVKRYTPKRSLLLMLLLSFTGVFAALIGVLLLSNSPKLIAAVMLFAGGGIIYIMFQDIAPLSKRKGDWIPASGASIGFLIGMIGEKLLL